MNTRDVVICALKMEAKQNPQKKIVIGQKVITYADLANKIEQKFVQKKRLPKQEESFLDNFIDNSIKMYDMNPAFRTKMLELASLASA